jgi:serine/threonine protein kinase
VAPEVFEGEVPSTAADIWSIGCTVIELITGFPPYYEMANLTAIFHILEDDRPEFPPNISPVWSWSCVIR